jgi:hypothetical protein
LLLGGHDQTVTVAIHLDVRGRLLQERRAIGARQASDDEGVTRISPLEYQNNLPAYVRAMDVLGGAGGHSDTTDLPGIYHERRRSVVLESEQHSDHRAVQSLSISGSSVSAARRFVFFDSTVLDVISLRARLDF